MMSILNQNEIKKEDVFRCQLAFKMVARDSSGQTKENLQASLGE